MGGRPCRDDKAAGWEGWEFSREKVRTETEEGLGVGGGAWVRRSRLGLLRDKGNSWRLVETRLEREGRRGIGL